MVNGILRTRCYRAATIDIVAQSGIEKIIAAGRILVDRLHTDHVRAAIEIGISIVQRDGFPITNGVVVGSYSVKGNFTRGHIESRDFFPIDPHNGTIVILDAQRKRLRYLPSCDGDGIAIIHRRVQTLHTCQRRVDNIAASEADGSGRSRPVHVIENQLPPIIHGLTRFFGAADVFPQVACLIQINNLGADNGATGAP